MKNVPKLVFWIGFGLVFFLGFFMFVGIINFVISR